MGRNELIDRLAESTNRSKQEAGQVVDAVLAHIGEALEKGEKVDLRGFGNFQVSGRKERQGRNPKTGEAITIAAKRVVVFKPGKELAERVNRAPEASGEGAGLPNADSMPMAEEQEGSAKVHGDKIEG